MKSPSTFTFVTGDQASPVIEAIINQSERAGFDILCKLPLVRRVYPNHWRTTRNEFVYVSGEWRMIYSLAPRYVSLERINK